MSQTSYEIVREAAVVRLVIDFDKAAFLDSEAMGALIEGLNAGREADVPLRIVNAHGLVHRVLDVSGVLALFNDTP